MYELKKRTLVDEDGNETGVIYERARTMQMRRVIQPDEDAEEGRKVVEIEVPVIQSFMTKYSEKPKAVFLNTPPHKLPYAKLILILIKQLADTAIGLSYLTKENQAPLFYTNYMLEIG